MSRYKLGSCLSGNIDLAVVGHNWCQMCFSSKLSKIKTIPLYFNHFESFSCATLGCLAASGSSTNRNKEGLSLLHVNWNNTTILSISGHFLKNGKTTEACIWPYYDSEALGFVLIGYPNSRPNFFLHPSIHRSTYPSIINSSSTHPFKIRLLWTISRIFSLSASK